MQFQSQNPWCENSTAGEVSPRKPKGMVAAALSREGRHVKYSAGNFEGWSSIPFQARGGGEAPEDFTAQSSNEKSLTNPLSVFFFLSG